MGKLFCVSGNSGAGKTSIMRCVMGTKKEIVSVTTRPMRDGEIDGVDYYFITEPLFDELDKHGQLAEKTTYYGRASYGVTKAEINHKLSQGNAYIIVDFNGYQQLKAIYSETVGIFIFTDELIARNRMIDRGDKLESVESRLTTYETEIANMPHYDYIIKNNNFNTTQEVISKIVKVESGKIEFKQEYLCTWVGEGEN